MMSASFRFTTLLTVRSYEIDGYGHVNNAVFLRYLEAARGDMVRAVGFGYANFREWDAFPVITHASLDYDAPAHVDDQLEITITIAEWRRTQVTMRYEVWNRLKDRRILRAETRHAFVSYAGEVVRIPEAFRKAFE